MRHSTKLAAVLCLGGLATAAQARDLGAVYIECGLGGLIAQQTPALAVTTNITWDLGTTAISSEASSPESCKGGAAQTAMLILESYETIEQQLAAGQGEHLSALFTLAGVAAEDQADLIAALRVAFAEQVAREDYTSRSRFDNAADLHASLMTLVGEHAAG